MMNNCKRFKKVSTPILIKSSFWYTASSFLTKAIGFLTTPFFTRILTKEEIVLITRLGNPFLLLYVALKFIQLLIERGLTTQRKTN